MAHRGPDPDPLDSLEVRAVRPDPHLEQQLELLGICGMEFPEEAAGKTQKAADQGRERGVQRLLPGPQGQGEQQRKQETGWRWEEAPEPRDQMDTEGEGERGGEKDVRQGERGVLVKMASSVPAQRRRSFVLGP